MKGNDKTKLVGVSFLNARPLVYGLEENPAFDISYEIPSRCAEELAAGRADCGLIPVIEYKEDYSVVPGICIASEKEAASVLLVSRVPLSEIEGIHLDRASRTSAGLLRILMELKYGIHPRYREFNPVESSGPESALIIGDRALRTGKMFPHVYDLASEWRKWLNLPFVFAFWAARNGRFTGDQAKMLISAGDRGTARLREIAARWAEDNPETEDFYYRYLSKNLNYRLDEPKIEAIKKYYELAARIGLINRAPDPVFF